MRTFSRAVRVWVAVAVIAVAMTSMGATLTEDVLGNLQAMKVVYQTGYAPAEWKKKQFGYDLNEEYAKAEAAVHSKSQLTTQDARSILKDFIYSMRDYHTSISFVATEAASLPLLIKSAQGKAFIVSVDRSKLSSDAFPFSPGDEVVRFGGVPTQQVIDEVQAEVISNVPGTDQALAEVFLTRRRALRGQAVPQGPITLEIRPQGSDSVRSIQLLWDYTPEKVAPRGLPETLASFFSFLGLKSVDSNSVLSRSSIFRPRMDVNLISQGDLDSPFDLGRRQTFTPNLGPKIWESSEQNTFYAYIYRNEQGRLIGYLRLPSYTPDNSQKAVGDFAGIIAHLEAHTDSLVIDQVNNPGGSVFYLYALASMLTKEPLKTPRHRMSITQSDVAEALGMLSTLDKVKSDEEARRALGDDADGYPISYEFARFTASYARFLVDEWEKGHRLSAPYWIAGVDHINPAAVHYTKPILVLVNHLDFSGGDFFPAILQDNKRVTIMGSRTAGAGGYVLDVKIPNNVGIDSFRFTGSIAERVDGNPIENLGVIPDIEYEMTESDYTQNFSPYVRAIREAVSQLTK